jgi:site-specific DNA-methyltransferase (adenine-specific)
MAQTARQIALRFSNYRRDATLTPLFLQGKAEVVLKALPADSIDCVMTSPPYWGKREYGGGIGQEKTWDGFVRALLVVFAEVRRVLKPTGSFWLDLGDSYLDKCLLGIPWRVALAMIDRQDWILRNQVVWHKVKGGPDNTLDKLRNVHEPLFHFVKVARGYYYDVDRIRSRPRSARVEGGRVVSATGVRGVRYERQLELSTRLTPTEKINARRELSSMLEALRAGELSDFRMIIRGQQRTTHSDSEQVSGRAKELARRGFYFLRYHPRGTKPSDVWDILPEDTQGRATHFAPYPAELCRLPLLATCPPGGTILDPFCGTGTTNLVAQSLGHQSVGIDLSAEYLHLAERRCAGHDR